MDWWYSKRSGGVVAHTMEFAPSGLSYMVIKGRNGYWVEAHRVGGAKARLPWQRFDTIEAAVAWVEDRERAWVETQERRRCRSGVK
jgi:transcriptional regulator CtsR